MTFYINLKETTFYLGAKPKIVKIFKYNYSWIMYYCSHTTHTVNVQSNENIFYFLSDEPQHEICHTVGTFIYVRYYIGTILSLYYIFTYSKN